MVGRPFGSPWLTLVVASYPAAAALTALLAAYVMRTHGERPLARVFSLLLGALTVWLLGAVARLFTVDVEAYVAITTVAYLGITGSAVCLLVFSLRYAGRDRWVSRRTVAGLLVVPVLTLVAVATTTTHGLFYREFVVTSLGGVPVLSTRVGPGFWGWAAFGWSVLLVSSGLIVHEGLRRSAFYRVQSALLTLGIAVSWAVNLAFIGWGWPHPAVDPTPLGLAVTGLLFTLGLFTPRLVEVIPYARSHVLDAVDDLVVALDPRDRVVAVNEAGRAVFDGAAPIGEPADEVLPAELRRRPEGTRSTVELSVGGDPAIYRYRRLPVGPAGIHGEVIVLTDVTTLVRARRELERQNDRLEEFASVVSHDLRTPLSVAQGNLELAMDDGELDRLTEVDGALTRMEALIDDLLALARQGQTVGATEPVDLAGCARAAWDPVESPGATLELDDELGRVAADADRLRQLLENLFRNAVEHGASEDRSTADAAGDPITVRVTTTADGFAVEDDGPGIDPADRDQVFEYGYTTAADGNGFGLGIVRSIAEAHGWSVTATEGTDGGARFDFSGVERP
ncbi:MAG: histidine kinase N-terminal 7TM domain-containing protein [Halobacteriales archaeon]